MHLSEYVGYVGRMKQPLQQPNLDNPTMFMVADSLKHELDLILLTSGTFLHAYNYIKKYNAKSVRIFTPSIGPYFISDVFNLIMSLRKTTDIKWVFPKQLSQFDNYTFNQYCISTECYENRYSREICIRYIENSHLENIYDIELYCKNESHYFSMRIEESDVDTLFKNKDLMFIHIPMSSTLYGGLTFVDLMNINRKYKRKFIPNNFVSVEEVYHTFKRDIPKDMYYDDPNEGQDETPEEYDGDITTDEILGVLGS